VGRLSAEARALLAARLAELRAADELTAMEVRRVAAELGVGERSVWRWAADGAPNGRLGRPPYRLSEAEVDADVACAGNAAAAWRARRAAGAAVPSLRAFQAAIARQLRPIERAAAADGIQGQRRHSVYLRWEAEQRNQRWEADHVELPVLVLAPRARRAHAPWVTLFVDAFSRLVMGWALAVTPSTASVLAGLRVGLVVDPARGPFGGVPGVLRPDRGLEFAAGAIGQAARGARCARAARTSAHAAPEGQGRAAGPHDRPGFPVHPALLRARAPRQGRPALRARTGQ
jgi:putative transposase